VCCCWIGMGGLCCSLSGSAQFEYSSSCRWIQGKGECRSLIMTISEFLCPFMVELFCSGLAFCTPGIKTTHEPGNANQFSVLGRQMQPFCYKIVSKSSCLSGSKQHLKRFIYIKLCAHYLLVVLQCWAASFHSSSCHQVGVMTPLCILGNWEADADRSGGAPILVNGLTSMLQSIVSFLFPQ